MHLQILDIITLVAYGIIVISIGLLVSRKQKSSGDYFLASKNLPWYVIGSSLIAANISTHHFVGMAGVGYEVGMAIGSYEWLAIIGLLLLAWVLLPYYLRSGIYTMSEFLENRYNSKCRAIYAFITVLGYVIIELSVVLYTGALALETIFNLPLQLGIILVAILGGIYTIYGGLKAVVWTDLVHLLFLIGGGLAASIIGISHVGGWGNLMITAGDKFHMVLPANHPILPWPGVFFGITILAVWYWATNQFIVQRTLGARTELDGRLGVVFAGFLKLLVPFIVILPGIIASVLFPNLAKGDMAFPMMVQKLLPVGITGVVMAGLLGAIVSTMDSLLNSSATIVIFDFYKKYFKPNAEDKNLVKLGRIVAGIILVLSALWAPYLQKIGLIFIYIQNLWSYITPAFAVVFLFGIFWKKANQYGALATLIAGIPLSLFIEQVISPGIVFLHRMIICFVFCVIIMVVVSIFTESPKKEKIEKIIWKKSDIKLTPELLINRSLISGQVSEISTKKFSIPKYKDYRIWSGILIILTIALYIIFA